MKLTLILDVDETREEPEKFVAELERTHLLNTLDNEEGTMIGVKVLGWEMEFHNGDDEG